MSSICFLQDKQLQSFFLYQVGYTHVETRKFLLSMHTCIGTPSYGFWFRKKRYSTLSSPMGAGAETTWSQKKRKRKKHRPDRIIFRAVQIWRKHGDQIWTAHGASSFPHGLESGQPIGFITDAATCHSFLESLKPRTWAPLARHVRSHV